MGVATAKERGIEGVADVEWRRMDVLEAGEGVWREVLGDGNGGGGGGVQGDGGGVGDGGLVVGVDINGNRELEAVRECLGRVLEWWRPRLVVVKSRALFQVFEEEREGVGGGGIGGGGGRQ